LEVEREVNEMLEKDRKLLRKRLDEEMRHFRRAGKEPGPINGFCVRCGRRCRFRWRRSRKVRGTAVGGDQF